MHSILKNSIEVKSHLEINTQLYKFYKNLFKENLNTSKEASFFFFENINLPKLTNEQAIECEGVSSETELLKALKSIKNNKFLGNDGTTKEFNEFLMEIYIKKFFISGELSTSQKQEKSQRKMVNPELVPNFFVKYRY